MIRVRLFWLLSPLLLALAGCIVIVQAPPGTPTLAPPVLTATQIPPTLLTPMPAVIGVATAGDLPTALPTFTPAAVGASLPPGTFTATLPFASTPVTASGPISITLFTASPAEVRPGELITLTWEVFAEQATLWQLDALGRQGISYTIPLSGTLVISASETARNEADFVLFATSGQSSAQAFVSVRISCPDAWFFPNPPADCPSSPPHYTTMQAEHFQRGLMLWTEWNRLIYIIYMDDLRPRWEARVDAWTEGMPPDNPAIVPPLGYYQPVRGFGVAWRDEQAPAGARVRDRLGWATDEEFPVSNAAFQCDARAGYSRCYITGPNSQIYALEPELSGWFVWAGPTPTPQPGGARS